MRGYVIRVGTKKYATNADNLMEAEDKFINEFPQFESVKFTVSEASEGEKLNGAVIVF